MQRSKPSIQLASVTKQAANKSQADLAVASTRTQPSIFDRIKDKIQTFKSGEASRSKMQEYVERKNAEQTYVYPFGVEKDPLVLKVLCQLLYDELESSIRKNAMLSPSSRFLSPTDRSQLLSRKNLQDSGSDIMTKINSLQANRDLDLKKRNNDIESLRKELEAAKKTVQEREVAIVDLKVENRSYKIKNEKSVNTLKEFSSFLEQLKGFLEDLSSWQSDEASKKKQTSSNRAFKINTMLSSTQQISQRMLIELKNLAQSAVQVNKSLENLPLGSKVMKILSQDKIQHPGGIKKSRIENQIKSTPKLLKNPQSHQVLKPAAQLIKQQAPVPPQAPSHSLPPQEPEKSNISQPFSTFVSQSRLPEIPSEANSLIFHLSPDKTPTSVKSWHAIDTLADICRRSMSKRPSLFDDESKANLDVVSLACRVIAKLEDAGPAIEVDKIVDKEGSDIEKLKKELEKTAGEKRELCGWCLDQINFIENIIDSPQELVQVFKSKNIDLIHGEASKVKLFVEKVENNN